jgi:tetratricopeptide (TPR) repeat protein
MYLFGRQTLGMSLPALLLTLVLAPSASPAQAPPPLPTLPLDAYPAAAREDLSRAHRAAAARPSDAEAVGFLARLLHAWEQWNAAHAVYARAQALAPDGFDWHYLDGVVLQRLARHADAAARFRAALTLDRGYLPARVKLAEALFEAGRLEESRALYEELVREPAAEPAALFGLGRIAAAEGRHDDAARELQRATSLFPEWGGAHYALALSLRALGRRDEAQRALEAHARHGPRWPAVADPLLEGVAALRDDAGTLLRRGKRLAEKGDLAGAIAAYEAALARDPSLAIAHANLLRLYGRTQDWAQAEAHYRAAVAGGADPAEAHYDYGVLLDMQERWDDAAAAYRRSIDVNPSYAEALNNLGQLHERRRELEPALELYRRAAASRPTFRMAGFNAGRMLVALGRPEEASLEFERLVPPRDAEAPRYLFALSVAKVRAGHRERGLALAEEAKRLAAEFGQRDLIAAIERDLASLK